MELLRRMDLTLRLFGTMELLSQDAPLPPGPRRHAGERLLGLLALQGPQPRVRLAATLWPEVAEERSQFYLRRTLMELRQRLGEAAARLVESSVRPRILSLQLPPTSCDLWRFEQALKSGDDLTAVSLYQGPLLDGWDDDWVLSARVLYQQQFLSALERLAMRAQTSQEAIAQLQRLVALDPARESAWRALMQALADRGDPAALVQAYRELRVWLRREVRLEPSAETLACYQRLRSEARRRSAPAVAPTQAPLRYRLPLPPTPLVGRETALTEIRTRLQTTRLLTLVGMGGVGKTRLALATLEARQLDTKFADGVAWIELASLSDPTLLGTRVASSLGIPETTELTQAIGQRHMLLGLDNCEHLLDAVANLADTLLSTCPNLVLLTTSREPLGLASEALWRVPTLSGTAALQLFEARAQKVATTWTLTAKNTPLVQQLCTRLDDLPFAIELAAARIATLPLEELVRRVDARFDLLTGGNRSALRRQQTLRATMDWSWALLTSEEQNVLRQLAIFPSPFSLEISEAACPGSLSLLSSLVEKSLIGFTPETGQYRLLETVREYIMEQGLGESGRTARHRYLRYACQTVEKGARNHSLPSERRLWHDTLEATYDNLRLALENALEASPAQALHLAAYLWPFWWERGYWQEGLRTLQAVLETSTNNNCELWVRAQLGAGVLSYETGKYAQAHLYLAEAQKLARLTNDAWTEGEALRIQGLVRWNEGHPEEARTLYHQSQACFQQSGNIAGQAGALASLGHLTWNLGNLEQSTQYNLQSRSLYQSLGDEVGLAETSAQLGLIARSQSDYKRARTFFEEALTLRRKLGLRSGIVTVLHHLGVLAYLEHRYDDAQTRLHESVSLWRVLGDPGWLALSLYYLGLVQRAQRTWPEAILSLTEALLLRRHQGAKRSIAGLQYALGTIWLEQGHYEDAHLALQESTQLRHEIGLPVFCGEALDALACLHARQGDYIRATAHLACAAALRKGHEEIEEEHPYRDEAMTKTTKALSAEDWQCLWQESMSLSPLTL